MDETAQILKFEPAEESDPNVQVGEDRTLWLTEISRATYDDQGLALGGDGGVFLVLEDRAAGRFDVLAKVPSSSAGMALLDLVAGLRS